MNTFSSVRGMLRRRTTAGDNFLTSYMQNYSYILHKLGTLTLKASARFFAHRRKPWLAEAANCSVLQEVLLQPQEKCLTLKLSQELTLKFLVKFKL